MTTTGVRRWIQAGKKVNARGVARDQRVEDGSYNEQPRQAAIKAEREEKKNGGFGVQETR